MTPFPRDDYRALTRYEPHREPVEIDLRDNTNLWGTHRGALARIRATGLSMRYDWVGEPTWVRGDELPSTKGVL